MLRPGCAGLAPCRRRAPRRGCPFIRYTPGRSGSLEGRGCSPSRPDRRPKSPGTGTATLNQGLSHTRAPAVPFATLRSDSPCSRPEGPEAARREHGERGDEMGGAVYRRRGAQPRTAVTGRGVRASSGRMNLGPTLEGWRMQPRRLPPVKPSSTSKPDSGRPSVAACRRSASWAACLDRAEHAQQGAAAARPDAGQIVELRADGGLAPKIAADT